MKNALRQELYRVFHSWPLLALLAVCLVLAFCLGSVQPLSTEELYVQMMEATYGIAHIDAAKAVMQLVDDPARTWEELYREVIVRENYFRFMEFVLGLLPAALVLSLFQLGSGRERGTIRSCAMLGGSVRNVILARLTVFYLLALVILVPVMLLQTAVYCRGLEAHYSSGVLLRNGVMRVLLELGLLGIYAWLGLCVRRRGLRLALLLLAGPVLLGLNFIGMFWQTLERPLFIPIPPILQGETFFYVPEAGAGWVLLTVPVSLAWVILPGWACLRSWERELGTRD